MGLRPEFWDLVQEHAEFLKIDFPRLPLTSNVELFRELCALGKELVALHLRIGIDSLKEIINDGLTVKHLKF